MTDPGDRLSPDDQAEFRFWGFVLVGLVVASMALSSLLGFVVNAVLAHRQKQLAEVEGSAHPGGPTPGRGLRHESP